MVADSTLKERVERLIVKSNQSNQSYPGPSRDDRDNSHNHGRPPFQPNQRSRGDFTNNPCWTQLSMMSESLVQALKLHVHKLNKLIEAEASGRGVIPYVSYVEARLAIPRIKKMDKDSLFMVSNNSPYTKKVPIHIRTLQIREALQLATKEEKEALPQAWETSHHKLWQNQVY